MHRELHSFPTRRSSDLDHDRVGARPELDPHLLARLLADHPRLRPARHHHLTVPPPAPADRKSTRLNSSHLGISYAVSCLKKKNYTTANVHCKHRGYQLT